MRRKVLFQLLSIVLITFAVIYLSAPASASSSGISGFSGKSGSTFTSCHGGGLPPTVTLTAPTSVTSGSTDTYTLTITGGSDIAGGLDVAASGGAFAVLPLMLNTVPVPYSWPPLGLLPMTVSVVT
jgi:hypothetical protein